MADDTATVRDKAKVADAPAEKNGAHASELHSKDSLAILRSTENKAKADLPDVELFDSKRNGGQTKVEGPATVKHGVKEGDTLSHIVEKHLAKNEGESKSDYSKRLYATVAQVAEKNGIANPNKIEIGQVIELPEQGKKAARPADTALPRVEPADTTLPRVTPVDTALPRVAPADAGNVPAVPAERVPKPVDVESMRQKADVLYGATEGKWGIDKPLTNEVLKNLNQDERKVLNDLYKAKHGKNIDEVLRDELSGKDLTESLSYLRAKDNQTGANRGRADRAAEAIDEAANGGVLGIGTDKKAIEAQLKGKTAEELKDISEAFLARTGHTLQEELKDELSGSDLTKLTAMAAGKNDDAARINATLEEHKEWGIGARSNANCEKDLRDTISTLNSQQIADLDKTYQERYGKSLKEVLQNDDNLPQATKDALGIYLKGTDKITPADTLAISDIALKSGNQDMFQEAFRSASPEARAQFMQNGGEQKVTEAFGTAYTDEYSGATTYSANSETARAMDYVKSGKLDTATKIGDNTGVFNDNEDAIVATINQMSAAERQSYAAGQKLATADAATLNPPDKANLEYYNKVHSALDKAGNEREMAKWEDMIATGKDGSLVTRLAAHGGMIDDGMGKVLGTIESMPKEDWERLKSDPEYRKKVEATLAIDLSDSEMARAREAIDKKMVAGTFEESKNAQRSVVEAVKDERGVFNDNEEGIIRALEKMTPDDQRKYREDPEFKKQLDAQVAKGMDYGSERDAAMRILDKVAKGEKPESDIVSKLEMHSNDFNTDEAKVIADIEASFRNDPTLRDRLRNPQTAEDKVMAEKFNTAIHKALDQDEYDKYAKPLIENGRIPFAVKAELFKGTFDDDENGVYDALKKGNGTPEDWKELLTNAEKTLPFMSADEREVAMNIARQQGVMKPEDELRAAILGAGTDEAKIKEVLATFDPAKLQAAKDSYETKYGASLTGDVLGELGGSDKANAERALRGPQTAREAYNDIRTDVSEGVDGIGESVVNALDGTAAMTKDQVEQLSADMALNSKNGTEMSLEAVKGHQDAVYGSLDLYSESEKAAAQTAALVATTILTLPVSGGASLALLAARAGGLAATGTGSALLASAVTGAVVELGVETAIRGKNFDYGSADVVTALGAGAVNGGTMLLGGAQVGAALKVGEGSAIAAAKTVVAEVDNLAVAGGRQLLKEGAEATITKEIAEQVAVTISNGSKVVDDKAVAVIAEKVAASASDVPQIEQVIKANLAKAIEAEAAKGSLAAKEIALNTGAGVVGGGLTGGVNGASEGGSVEEIAKQVVMGAAFGGFAAGGVTALTKGAGRAASAFRHGDELHVPGSALESDAGSELSRVKLDRNGRVSEVAAPEGKIKIGYHKSGDLQGEVREVAFANNVTYSSKDGATWTVKDATAPGGKYEIKAKITADADGNITFLQEGADPQIVRANGSRVRTDRITGEETTTDVLGYVREIKNDRGGVKFDYDHDGHVQSAKFADGKSIDVSPEGKVVQTNADGTKIELDGRARVNNDGQLSITPSDGSPAQILTNDGGRIQYDGDSNRISNAWSADGKHYQYEYGADGQLAKVTLPDGHTVSREPDGLWAMVDDKGNSNGFSSGKYEVKQDGSFAFSQGDRSINYGLDGHSRVYDQNKKLIIERGPDGAEIKARPALGVDGRPVEFQEKVRDKFVVQSAETKERSLELVSEELKSVRAFDAKGKPTSAYESLMSDKTLSATQKQNILDNMSEIREHFASYRAGDRMHPDPEVNWIHTQGEMAKVLEVGRKAGLKADELEDALLASMYSDSVKFAFPPPKGAAPNFFTHHLDGALAAQESLSRKGFPPERIERIVQAIKEHQIAPPEFMGMLYLNGKIRPALTDLGKNSLISEKRYKELIEVLNDMTVVGPDNIARLKPIAQPNEWPKVRNADGSWDLVLTPDQRELFKLAGIDGWKVPVNPVDTPGFKQLPKAEQDALISKFKISSTLIDGDGVDNYATLGGASKIVAIRGPGTTFKDGNVWQSIDSIDSSYKDAYTVLSPKGREVADASLAQRNALLNDEQTGIKAQMTQWLESKGLKPEDVVYFQRDGKLKYPEAPTEKQLLRMMDIKERLNQKPTDAAEVAALNKELHSFERLGMSDEEIRQFELAGEVRAKMTELLRSGHRTDGSLPGQFPAARVDKPE